MISIKDKDSQGDDLRSTESDVDMTTESDVDMTTESDDPKTYDRNVKVKTKPGIPRKTRGIPFRDGIT